MLHLPEYYFNPLSLMCPVREQQHGSLTCHIVAWRCLMIRGSWKHSAASGANNCCGGLAILPQICLGAVADAVTGWCSFFSIPTHFIFFCARTFSRTSFRLSGFTPRLLLSFTKWIFAFINCIQSQKRLKHEFVHAGFPCCLSWDSDLNWDFVSFSFYSRGI